MMKKKIAGLVVGLMMVVGAGSAYAAQAIPPESGVHEVDTANAADSTHKLGVLVEFKDELHQINTLREARLGTKTQLVQKQDQILDLTIAAREAGNKNALREAAAVKKQLPSIHEAIKTLWDQISSDMKAFKQAVKAGDTDQAQTHIDSVISNFSQVNEKLNQEAGLLDQIIEILK